MKYALIALGLLITTGARAECYKVISGDRVRTGWGTSEQGYSIECDGGSYQEDRGLTSEEASARLDKRQLEEDYDRSDEAKARAEAINAEIEKERQKALVHPPISY